MSATIDDGSNTGSDTPPLPDCGDGDGGCGGEDACGLVGLVGLGRMGGLGGADSLAFRVARAGASGLSFGGGLLGGGGGGFKGFSIPAHSIPSCK